MGVVKKDGKYRLEKNKDGVYLVTERKDPIVKIITSEYDANDIIDERIGLDVREVRDFKEAKKEFQNVIDEREKGFF